VSTPGSPQYRAFVSPAQWISRFSPTQQQYDKVLAHLRRGGFTITGTPASRLFVVFRGTAAQLDALFGTSLHMYDIDGRRLAAPSAAPTLPADVAPAVSGMELDQGRQLTHPDSRAAGGGSTPAPSSSTPVTVPAPCSGYYGQHTATLPPAYGRTSFPTVLCGYVPAQLRAAYGIGSTGSTVLASNAAPLTGAGQTVAIVDAYASPTIASDVNTYSSRHGEPGLTNGQLTQLKPGTFYDQAACEYPSGWQSEETLDVEAVHAIAPAAKILYVGAFDCNGGIDVALSQILDGRLATIVSNSYGWVGEAVPADALRGEENQHLQAAAEGIGLYYSSGDNGDESTALGSPQPDYPGSSPWVTSVGGTSTGIAQDGTVAAETGWGTASDLVVRNNRTQALGYAEPLPGEFYGGAGGGRSTIFAEPGYQRGVVPDPLARGNRVSPDVAADADPDTGFLIGLRPIVDDATLATGPYTEVTYGGTSLSSPLVAAQMALVQQAYGLTLGFANPAIYAVYRAAPQAYRDVTAPGSPLAFAYTGSTSTYLDTTDRDTSLRTTRGYDDVTGLGAVTFAGLRRTATG
jgi:subtilase family serine protease